MWNLKNKIKDREYRLVVDKVGVAGGEIGEESQKLQIPSYKMNAMKM